MHGHSRLLPLAPACAFALCRADEVVLRLTQINFEYGVLSIMALKAGMAQVDQCMPCAAKH